MNHEGDRNPHHFSPHRRPVEGRYTQTPSPQMSKPDQTEPPSAEKPQDKGASLLTLDERTAAMLRNFLSMSAAHQRKSADHSEKLDVVRLSIELARLRGVKEPELFLDEAARLLTEARFAMSREQTRPEREAKAQRDQMIQTLTQEFSEQKVPFAKLCRPPGKDEKIGASALPATEVFEYQGENGVIHFEWRVYRGEREFKELLEKHAKRIYDTKLICDEVSGELARLKKVLEARQKDPQTSGQPANTEAAQSTPSWGQVAVALFANRFWFPEDWRNKFLAVESSEAGAPLIENYVKAAIPAFQERLWQMAKADHLDTCTLFSIHQTRLGTYKTRGPKRPQSEQGNV